MSGFVLRIDDRHIKVYRHYDSLKSIHSDTPSDWECITELDRREALPSSLEQGTILSKGAKTWIHCEDELTVDYVLSQLTIPRDGNDS